jgi:hypothetical protein
MSDKKRARLAAMERRLQPAAAATTTPKTPQEAAEAALYAPLDARVRSGALASTLAREKREPTAVVGESLRELLAANPKSTDASQATASKLTAKTLTLDNPQGAKHSLHNAKERAAKRKRGGQPAAALSASARRAPSSACPCPSA